jgi:hypothetical protein
LVESRRVGMADIAAIHYEDTLEGPEIFTVSGGDANCEVGIAPRGKRHLLLYEDVGNDGESRCNRSPSKGLSLGFPGLP